MTTIKLLNKIVMKTISVAVFISLSNPVTDSILLAQESIPIPEEMDNIEFLKESRVEIDQWFTEIAEIDSIKMVEVSAIIDSLNVAKEQGDNLKIRLHILDIYTVLTEVADFTLAILADILEKGELIRVQASEVAEKLDSINFGNAKQQRMDRIAEIKIERYKRLASIGAVADLAKRLNHFDEAYSTKVTLHDDLKRLIGNLRLDWKITNGLYDMINNERWKDLEMVSSQLLNAGAVLENIWEYEDYGVAITMVASGGIAYLRDLLPMLMANSEIVRKYSVLIANLGTLPRAPSELLDKVDVISGTGTLGLQSGGVLDKLVKILNDTNSDNELNSAPLMYDPKFQTTEVDEPKSTDNELLDKLILDGMNAREELSKLNGGSE